MKCVFLIILKVFLIFPGNAQHEICQQHCNEAENCQSMKLSDKCYYIFNDKTRTWDEAKDLCTSKGFSMIKLPGNMGKIGPTLQELLRGKAADEFVWLGAQAHDLNSWTFVNGVSLNDAGQNHPSNFTDGQEMHLCAVVSDGKIDKADCRIPNKFVCRFENFRNLPSTYVSEFPATWFEALSRCHELSASLFSLEKSEDFSYLKTRTSPFPGQSFFISLTRRLWKWEDETLVIHYNWAENEPNKFSEKCIAMYAFDETWTDVDCGEKMYATCQKELKIDGKTEEAGNTNLSGIFAAMTGILLIALIALAIYSFRKIKDLKQKVVNSKTPAQNEIQYDNSKRKSPPFCCSPNSRDNIYEEVKDNPGSTLVNKKGAEQKEVTSARENSNSTVMNPPSINEMPTGVAEESGKSEIKKNADRGVSSPIEIQHAGLNQSTTYATSDKMRNKSTPHKNNEEIKPLLFREPTNLNNQVGAMPESAGLPKIIDQKSKYSLVKHNVPYNKQGEQLSTPVIGKEITSQRIKSFENNTVMDQEQGKEVVSKGNTQKKKELWEKKLQYKKPFETENPNEEMNDSADEESCYTKSYPDTA